MVLRFVRKYYRRYIISSIIKKVYMDTSFDQTAITATYDPSALWALRHDLPRLEDMLSRLHGGIPVVCYHADAEFLKKPAPARYLWNMLHARNEIFKRIRPEIINNLADIDAGMQVCVAPHDRHSLVLNSEDDIWFLLSQKGKQAGLVYVAPPLQSPDKDRFARSSGVDASAIEILPDMNLYGAIQMGHEVEHTFQLCNEFEPTDDLYLLYQSYAEVSADKNALGKTGFDSDIVADFICTRAMNSIMALRPSHWTALHLHAVKEGSTILRHQDVVASTSGFNIQFLAALEGIRLLGHSTKKINEAGSAAWKNRYQELRGEICARPPTDNVLDLLAYLSTRARIKKHPVEQRLRVLHRLCTEDRFDDPLARKLSPLALEWIERHAPKVRGKRLNGKLIAKVL